MSSAPDRSPSSDLPLRDQPLYTVRQAAYALSIPGATIRYWATGRTSSRRPALPPVIDVPDASSRPLALSFTNLVEAHVLRSLRRRHRKSLTEIRAAVAYLEDKYGVGHPLAHFDFFKDVDTDDLLVRKFGEYLNVSTPGQASLLASIRGHVQRIIRQDELAIGIALCARTDESGYAPSPAEVYLGIAYGEPIIAGTNMPIAAVAERWEGGDSIHDLAQALDIPPTSIERALQWDALGRKAA